MCPQWGLLAVRETKKHNLTDLWTSVTCAQAHTMRQPSMQSGSTREQRKAAGSSAGEQGRAGQQSKAARQRSRAGQQGKAAGQGSKAAGQGNKRNSICKRPQRCEHLLKNMSTLARVVEHWQNKICKRLQRCEHLSRTMSTFS